MTDTAFEKLIAESLREHFDTLPAPVTEEHVFSELFEKRMALLLSQDIPPSVQPRKVLRMRRWWFVLAAVLLAGLAGTLTAYGTRSHNVHLFADSYAEYQPAGALAEEIPEHVDLTYDFDTILLRYRRGVRIENEEQFTQFFLDEQTGCFLEFSSYPKLIFRYHVTDALTEEPLQIPGREAVYYTDGNGMQYILWTVDATVIVLRSDLDKEQLIEDFKTISVYESGIK